MEIGKIYVVRFSLFIVSAKIMAAYFFEVNKNEKTLKEGAFVVKS